MDSLEGTLNILIPASCGTTISLLPLYLKILAMLLRTTTLKTKLVCYAQENPGQEGTQMKKLWVVYVSDQNKPKIALLTVQTMQMAPVNASQLYHYKMSI